MNDTPQPPLAITPENPPQFPCWLWQTSSLHGNRKAKWIHVNPPPVGSVSKVSSVFTHWHPDQSYQPGPISEEEGVMTNASGGVTLHVKNLERKLSIVTRERDNALDQWNRLIGEHHKTGEALSDLHHSLVAPTSKATTPSEGDWQKEADKHCDWLRANSSGVYRPSAEAAGFINRLLTAFEDERAASAAKDARIASLEEQLRKLRENAH